MYGPISKDGPALEFGKVGDEIKDEVRQQVVGEVAEKIRGKVGACDVDEVVGECDPFWSEENQEHLRRAAERLDSGEGVERGLIEEE